MIKIGFVGAYDKTDIILYIAKIISLIGKKVLVIDSTINQKAKYVVPVINPTKSYITEFEGMDIAVGFNNLQQIQEYLGTEDKKIDYDIVLIDIDSTEAINIYGMKEANKNYFVTSFDLYSLKRGIEILDGLNETVKLKKVLFSKYASSEEDDYLNFLSLGHKIVWESERIYFPFEFPFNMRKMMTASSKSHYSTKAGKCKPPKREFERRMKKGSRRGVLREPFGGTF